MHLNLSTQPSAYHSQSQLARVLTERWFLENGYCPACTSEELAQTPNNEIMVDFICPNCASKYQLKAKSQHIGKSVANGAYQPKIDMIHAGTAPNWFFMEYDRKDWLVENVMLVPAHFVTPDIVQKRNPLKPTARRAGWVGSNVLIGKLPLDARIYIVRDSEEIPHSRVRKEWKRFAFLKGQKLDAKGWLNDVLSCVRELNKKTFTLEEMYSFDARLQKQHPTNHNVRPKIRQQLQMLRDNGILEFVGRGQYKMKI
jgi:type II restriction enzyme